MNPDERELTERRVPPNATDVLPTAEIGGAPSPARASKRHVFLLVYHRDGVETVALAPGSSVIVGRQPPADLVIADRCLSSRHARFTLVAAEEVAVEDLGSTNGTRIGGRRVERATLKPSEEVLLGSIVASVHVVQSGEQRALGLDRHDTFRAALEAEILRARCFGRGFTVMMVRAERPGDGHLSRFCPRVRGLLRSVDRVALYSADTLEILLPEVDEKHAIDLARSITVRHEGEPLLVCGIAAFPGAAASVEELIEVSLDAAKSATAEQPVLAASTEVQRMLSRNEVTPRKAADEGIVLESAAMRAVAKTAARLSQSAIPVLLQGETGTGKEVVAKLIHEGSARRQRPLICVNCGAIPATLVESTFFGQEKGSYSGAVDKKGVFEAASGGTVFLDEIGELPLPAQVALLRVLETKRVTKVGATREIEVDVRMIAATHRDLEAMVEEGTFRVDLLNRVNTFELAIPPLRERREEIPKLCARFLERASLANQPAEPVRSIDPEAMALLERYPWPGNVRELRNAIERAVVLAEGDAILPRDLPDRLRRGSLLKAPPESAPSPPVRASQHPTAPQTSPGPKTGSLKARVETFEKDTIIDALREANGNQTVAARILEVPLRTLQHKIQAYGIRRGAYGVE